MLTFLEELRKDHRILLDSFRRIGRMEGERQEKVNGLLQVKDFLLAHLKKEDERLYPMLEEIAKQPSYKHLQESVIFAVKDMEEVTTITLDFFIRYTHKTFDPVQFEKDLSSYTIALARRIAMEETTLFSQCASYLNAQKVKSGVRPIKT